MPRSVFNWTFDYAARFLKEHGFRLNHIEGSHFYYVDDKKQHQVCIPFHGSKALKPRTFKGIVRQSGIPLKEWLK